MLPVHDPVEGNDLVNVTELDTGIKITHATSFDDLDLGEIVDPVLLSPHLPYRTAPQQLTHTSISHSHRVKPLPTLPQTTLHVRSKSLGKIVTAVPGSPPRMGLPPVPTIDRAEVQGPFECSPASQLAETGETRGASDGYFWNATTKLKSLEAQPPASFLSLGESTIGSEGSVASEEDASQMYHTAPVSPSSMRSGIAALKLQAKPVPLRPSRHTRQSSSTSTLKMLFKRNPSQDMDNVSDSETDSDALPTPTDTMPRPFRHKRGSSFFKVLDRLRSTT